LAPRQCEIRGAISGHGAGGRARRPQTRGLISRGARCTVGARQAGKPPRAMSTPARISIVLRNCHTLDEFEACVALEKRVWQTADIEIVPSALIRVVAETGGQVLGAFESGRMIGFTFALAGCRT